jgi:hypothetical protein
MFVDLGPSETLFGIKFEALYNEVFGILTYFPALERVVVITNELEQARNSFSLEREFSEEHLVIDDANRPKIGSKIIRKSPHHLGCHSEVAA